MAKDQKHVELIGECASRCSELVYWSSKWIVDAIKATLIAVKMDPDAVQVSLVRRFDEQGPHVFPAREISWSAVIPRTRMLLPSILSSGTLLVSQI